MRLAKLTAFRRLVYAQDSAPCLKTLRGWVRDGKIPGGRIEHGHFWVDLDAYDRATGLREGIEARRQQLAAELQAQGLV